MMNQDPHSSIQAQGGGYGPPPGGYGPPPGGAPGGMPGAPGGMPMGGAPMAPPGGHMPGGMPGGGGAANPELRKQAKTWMIISFVTMFCCSSCFGLIGGILCYMAGSAMDQGNMADGEAKLKWGKIVTIIGIVLGSIGIAISIVLQVLAQM